MDFPWIIYWGLAYTTGIACVTVIFLRYFLKREGSDLKIGFFLLTFGMSIICLSIREGYRSDPRISSVAGCLALVGASLILTIFPYFALGFDNVKRRRAMALALRITGFGLAILNVLTIFVRIPNSGIIMLLTISLLGFTIFLCMSWISRSSVRWATGRKPAWMASLFVFFALVLVFDFFRSLFPGLFPALAFLDGGYVILPAFYAYLNVFLLYNHVTVWAKALEDGNAGPEAREDLLERFGISKRESEVLGLLRLGRTYLEMADGLCVSLATIKSHVSHLYEKTRTRNKVELINLLYDSSASREIQPKSG
jgi:DNA-binding CsgD family transcriptional regulator